MTLERIIAAHRSYDAETDLCACGTDLGTVTASRRPLPHLHAIHVADQIREWLLSDEVIQRAGKGATEVESIRKANHGHPETCAEHAIRAALTAALDQGDRDQ